MKQFVLALTLTGALAGQAIAADMPVKARPAAPVPVAVANWTGCYVGGGGGYGLWYQENTGYIDGPPRVQVTDTFSNSGKGWFGTVQGGCDYQFSTGAWGVVVGAFADYDFSDINGRRNDLWFVAVGNEKLSSQWAVGGRIGVLVTPQLLTYFSGGYTEAHFDRTNYTNVFGPPFAPNGVYTEAATHKGWFLGSGYEYALGFLPGLYWKTEYRASHFDRQSQPLRLVIGGFPAPNVSYDSEKWVHTVRSELVWRFNWGGPVVAKY
ncbi:porin family protein [Bradyrhizobium sp.]|uniref:outer membrane protein n=1 Tax=Bradyrhizobium sp. TaxID=376 RepID=UPI001D475BC6|nr:porin family protein [Bradyrhizobium sp.]MBI5319410.1 porin family protein [Bradyrhizobium sp.]